MLAWGHHELHDTGRLLGDPFLNSGGIIADGYDPLAGGGKSRGGVHSAHKK